MEKNPNVKDLVTINLISRPQESYNCTSPNLNSRSKNMGLSIIEALILIFIYKKLFIWQSISTQLSTITVTSFLSNKKRAI